MATATLNDTAQKQPHVIFAAFFVTFSLGLLLILYLIGPRYYAAMEMSVPSATSWFQALVPWPMVGLAATTLLALSSMRLRLSQSGSEKCRLTLPTL